MKSGAVDEVIIEYEKHQLGYRDDALCMIERNPLQVENQTFYFSRVQITDTRGNKTNLFKYNDKIQLLCELSGDPGDSYSPEFRIYNELRQLVATGASEAFHSQRFRREAKLVQILIGPLTLTSGRYHISLSVMVNHDRRDTWENAIGFSITECQPFSAKRDMPSRIEGVCIIDHIFSEPSI